MTRPARGMAQRTALLAATMLLSFAMALSAHTALVRSEPARDARLPSPPPRVVLEFNEPVNPATSRVVLVGPSGDTLALALHHPSDSNAKIMEADVPAMGTAGAWRVVWRLIGADGHPVTGQFGFHVDSIPVPAADTLPVRVNDDEGAPVGAAFTAESPLRVAIRFIVLAALVLVIGSAAIALLVVPHVEAGLAGAAVAIPERSRAGLGSIARASAWCLAVVLPLRLVMQAASLSGSLGGVTLADLEVVLGHTRWGMGWTVQAIAVLLLLVAVRGGRGALAVRTGRWPLIAVAGVMLAIGASAMGHPSAVADAPLVAMGLDAIHAVGAGTWAGGLAALALVVLPLLMALPSELRTVAVQSALRAFSTIALASASVLAITGLVGGWWQLGGDLSALVASAYGRILLVKLAVVAAVAGLGAYHWRVAQPALAGDQSLARLRGTMRTELLLMLLVIVITAVLTGTPSVEAS